MASRPNQAAPRPAPRLYLVTPQLADPSGFTRQLTAALDAGDVAAVLLRRAEIDERTLINCAKALAPAVQSKDAALLLDGRPDLVARAGADGAHLTGLAAFSNAVADLKPERIVGAGGLVTRHDAMLVAEQGADYVMFGEPLAGGERPAKAAVEDRVAWWAEVFEVPCVGFAGSVDDVAPLVAAGADFVALGDFLWREPDSIATTMNAVARDLRLPEPTPGPHRRAASLRSVRSRLACSPCRREHRLPKTYRRGRRHRPRPSLHLLVSPTSISPTAPSSAATTSRRSMRRASALSRMTPPP